LGRPGIDLSDRRDGDRRALGSRNRAEVPQLRFNRTDSVSEKKASEDNAGAMRECHGD
jgi:hypothetical protein